MRKLTLHINKGIVDQRRLLRHQGLSWLKTGKSIRGLYMQHMLYVFSGVDERKTWLEENAVKDMIIV